MLTSQDATRIERATAYDTTGDKVGTVDRVYLDDRTGEPTFASVTTGFLGTSQSFVPLQGASFHGDDLRLGYEKDRIEDAPRVDADQHLTPAEEDEIYRYYGFLGAGNAACDRTTAEGHAESRRPTGDDVADTHRP